MATSKPKAKPNKVVNVSANYPFDATSANYPFDATSANYPFDATLLPKGVTQRPSRKWVRARVTTYITSSTR
jgi:hypothetical protein